GKGREGIDQFLSFADSRPSQRGLWGSVVGARLAERVAPHRDAHEAGELHDEPLPEPDAEVLQAGSAESFDFVQQRVIELAAQGEASFLQPREVGDEAVRRARDAADHDLGLEGMTVHAAVLVTARHTLETMA